MKLVFESHRTRMATNLFRCCLNSNQCRMIILEASLLQNTGLNRPLVEFFRFHIQLYLAQAKSTWLCKTRNRQVRGSRSLRGGTIQVSLTDWICTQDIRISLLLRGLQEAEMTVSVRSSYLISDIGESMDFLGQKSKLQHWTQNSLFANSKWTIPTAKHFVKLTSLIVLLHSNTVWSLKCTWDAPQSWR